MSSRTKLASIRAIGDVFALWLAWVLAYYLRFSGVLPIFKGTPEPILYFKLLPFIGIIWVAVFYGTGLYQRTGQHRSAIFEAVDILSGSALATLVFIAFTNFYEEYRYSRLVLLLFVVIHPIFIVTSRSVLRKFLRAYLKNLPPKKVLVIGGGPLLENAWEVSQNLGLFRSSIVGVMPFGDAEEQASAHQFAEARKIPIFTPPKKDGWVDFLFQNTVDIGVVAVSAKSYGEFWPHFEELSAQVLDIKIIPDILKYSRFATRLDFVGPTPILSIHESPLFGWGRIVKRFVDAAGAFFGLIVLSPLLLVVALVIKMTSKGPILYSQERMGMDGKAFNILKFRSMYFGAEEKSGAVWAIKGDDRTTPVGKILRSSSIDELPQLINVLKGDMSLVGPRPERPIFVEKFRKNVPDYMLRHKVKAGITGWAQVNGWRGNTSLEKRIECDLYYIQHWSLWFDVKIILLTFIKGFINKNAY